MCERTQKAHTCTYSIFGSLDKDTNSRTAQMKNEKKKKDAEAEIPGEAASLACPTLEGQVFSVLKSELGYSGTVLFLLTHHMPL